MPVSATSSRRAWFLPAKKDREQIPENLAQIFLAQPGSGNRLRAMASLFRVQEWFGLKRTTQGESISELLTSISAELSPELSSQADGERALEMDPAETARRMANLTRLFTRLMTALISELAREGWRDPELRKLTSEATQALAKGDGMKTAVHLQRMVPVLAERYNKDPKRFGPLLELTREFILALRNLPFAAQPTAKSPPKRA